MLHTRKCSSSSDHDKVQRSSHPHRVVLVGGTHIIDLLFALFDVPPDVLESPVEFADIVGLRASAAPV
jgi:hypothetical protein